LQVTKMTHSLKEQTCIFVRSHKNANLHFLTYIKGRGRGPQISIVYKRVVLAIANLSSLSIIDWRLYLVGVGQYALSRAIGYGSVVGSYL
jgi:hypothetical protein